MDTLHIALLVGASVVATFAATLTLALTIYARRSRLQVERELYQRTDQFISLASHYLLNPITVIQTALASLKEKGANLTEDKRDELYDAIERGQQRLWIVTQQMILVGEIDRGSLKLQMGVADVYDVVSSAVAAVDPFAREKKVTVHIKQDIQEIREARFDSRRMKQALIAVLDNAVKFSLEGGQVQVSIILDNGYFTIWVEDAGIGMQDELMSHITEKFFRGNDTYTFDYEGLGLGLYIAQAIVRYHQGNITFNSKAKRGTAVAIQFPNL